MQHKQYHPNNRWLGLLMGLVLLILFGFMLATTLWQDSSDMINSIDAFTYLRTGLHFAWGDGLGMYHYYPDIDNTLFVPTTHYPPMTSLVYGTLALLLPISPGSIPIIVSLAGWVALLAAIGVFTLQLGKSPIIAAVIIIIPATSYGFWFAFVHAMSETLFLPLLGWLMVLTYQLPQRHQGRRLRLVGVTVIIMLLILTRYAGVVVLTAVMLWWAWHWWYTPNRKLSTLVGDSALLASAALPFAAIIVYHKLQTPASFRGHLAPSNDSFFDGLWSLVIHSGQILIPNSTLVLVQGSWYGWLIYLPLLFILVWLLWYVAKQTPSWRQPHPTPAFIFLLGFVLLYTVVQPFFRFDPINWRDMTTILSLTIPMIGGAIAYLPIRWSYLFVISFVGINSIFSVANGVITPTSGIAYAPTPTPGMLEHYGTPEASPKEDMLFQQDPNFAIAPNLDVIHDQTTLLAWVEAQPKESVFLTNNPGLLAPYARGAIEDIGELYAFDTPRELKAWLDVGACTSHYPVYLLVFPVDRFARDVHAIQQQIERKCPGLAKQQVSHHTLYMLQRR